MRYLILLTLISCYTVAFGQEVTSDVVTGGEVAGGEVACGEVAGDEVATAISDAANAAEAVAKVKEAEKLAEETEMKLNKLLGEEEEEGETLGVALNPMIKAAAEKPGFGHCTVVTVSKTCSWWNVFCNDDLSLEIDTGVLGTYISKDAYTDGHLGGRSNASLVCNTEAVVRVMEEDMFGAKGVVFEMGIVFEKDGWKTIGEIGNYKFQFTALN